MSSDPTSGHFTYTSRGFLHSNEPRLQPALILKRFSSTHPRDRDQITVKWLKSQLGHYALKPSTGTKDELEQRLRSAIEAGHAKTQPKELRELEKALKAAYDARNGGKGKAAGSKVVKREGAGGVGGVQKKDTTAAVKKRPLQGAAAAANKANKKPAVAPRTKLVKPKLQPEPATKKPRKAPESFADRVLGVYNITSCPVLSVLMPDACDSMWLQLFREKSSGSSSPVIVGEFAFGNAVEGALKFDWLPMSKSTRVPVTWAAEVDRELIPVGCGSKGVIEFLKDGAKVKGCLESVGGFLAGRDLTFEGIKEGTGAVTGSVDWGRYEEVYDQMEVDDWY